MGLFQNYYNRPGPGVYKNQPKKKPFFLFWELFFRKFWKLIQLNLLFCIPVAAVLALTFLFGSFSNLAIVAYLPIILIFPFVGGITMITRNYAREEHAFLLSDFMDAVKNNWAAFLANGIISYAVYVILSVSLSYYYTQIRSNSIFIIPFALCLLISMVFLFAQYYIPVMIITFNLKLSQIYKNAMIFAVIGLWRNFLITAILGILLMALYLLFNLMPLTIIIAVLLLLLLLFSFCFFLINFAVYPLIDRMMIQPYREKDGNNKDSKKEDTDFRD